MSGRPNPSFLSDDVGATTIEYAIIALLVFMAVTGPIVFVGPKLLPYFQQVARHI